MLFFYSFVIAWKFFINFRLSGKSKTKKAIGVEEVLLCGFLIDASLFLILSSADRLMRSGGKFLLSEIFEKCDFYLFENLRKRKEEGRKL